MVRAHQLLDGLAPQHRAALTLRYLDGLSVPAVASVLGRTVDATEALLVRARRELRKAYEEGDGRDRPARFAAGPDRSDRSRPDVRSTSASSTRARARSQGGAGHKEEDPSPTHYSGIRSRGNGTRHGDVSYGTLALPDAVAGRRFYGGVLGWTFGDGELESQGVQTADVVPQVGLWPGSAWREGIRGARSFPGGWTTSGPRWHASARPADRPPTPNNCRTDSSPSARTEGAALLAHELPAPGEPAGPNGETRR